MGALDKIVARLGRDRRSVEIAGYNRASAEIIRSLRHFTTKSDSRSVPFPLSRVSAPGGMRIDRHALRDRSPTVWNFTASQRFIFNRQSQGARCKPGWLFQPPIRWTTRHAGWRSSKRKFQYATDLRQAGCAFAVSIHFDASEHQVGMDGRSARLCCAVDHSASCHARHGAPWRQA